MDNTLKRFFDKIEYTKTDDFVGVTVEKVVVNKKKETWNVYLRSKHVLPVEPVLDLITLAKKGLPDVSSIAITLNYDNVMPEDVVLYFNYCLNMLTDKNPSLVSLLDTKTTIDGETISIEVISKIEADLIKDNSKKIIKWMDECGLKGFVINPIINSEKRESIKKEIESTREHPTIKEEKKYKVIMGEEIKTKTITKLNEIMGEENNITVEAYIFGTEEFSSSKSSFQILTLKISDKTDSMLAKIFCKDPDEFKIYCKGLKTSKWYKFRGYTKNDQYARDIVLNLRDIEEIPSKDIIRVDAAEEKRIELHAHTMMSQMDGVVEAKSLLKMATAWGHKAMAFTDHNGAQSFPDIFHFVTDYNKGKEEEDKFKAIYGTELTLIDDSINIVHRGIDASVLDSVYCVFDLETTGFNAAAGDSIIEIGAVLVQNGEIIDRFNELINPGRKLPPKITEVTSITDAMLEDKDNEENAMKRFIAWFKDYPMVAHNAKFDTSFVEMAYEKYNLGTFDNAVIDTLEISRALDPDQSRHSLSALVKRWEIDFDEEGHHRADYDAEGTAKILVKMLKKIDGAGIHTIKDMNNLVKKDEIYKFGRAYHVNLLAKNKTGLKNLFKIISFANTKYLYKTPRILRSVIDEYREGILVGSGCYESEVFTLARSKTDEELINIINYYDYVEVQPPECYIHLLQTHDFDSDFELENTIKKIINLTKEAGKIIVASGDVHQLNDEDRIYREIIVNQKVPGGGRHPLAKNDIKEIPSLYFRTTNEMLDSFKFIGEELAHELVIENPKKIADMVDILEVIIDTGGIPFSPKIDKSVEQVTDLVYTKAALWYGDPLPINIEERIAKELYGDAVLNSIKDNLKREGKIKEEDFEAEAFKELHEVIMEGFDKVKELVRENVRINSEEELSEEDLNKKMKKSLGGIIGGGFDVIYLIAQKLVKHSNDEGYLVGSRGSVGSSFVATMMGITEVNPLPAHYRCPNCKHSVFEDTNGIPFANDYPCGFDLPDMICPECGTNMLKDGQDMPFATFLGFNADKVPDIDLNFSDQNQASAHNYTKVLFGEDNVYRAGTIGTVADKTAYGFVKGYCENKGIMMRSVETERLAVGCTGVKRTTGQHPGGIVVIPGYMDVFDFTPFQYPADDDTKAWRTTHFDYHAIDQDVLKLDILGHSGPTQLRMIQDLTGEDVTKVPLDDKETMGIFLSPEPLGVTAEQIMNETGTLGIPEFGTPFTLKMLQDTKPTTFGELIKISGLSHGTDVWLGNAQELIAQNVVPFAKVIGCRDDIMVYLIQQGLEPIKAFKIMEFVRKGKASKDPETWASHVETMKNAGIADWYIQSCQKIKYMFPKAHAAAYVINAYRIAYYKVHNPAVYYASQFSIMCDDYDIESMVGGYDAIKRKMAEINEKGYDATNKDSNILETSKIALEATARGFKFGNIDIKRSDASRFVIDEDGKTLICPFKVLDGLGENVANTIVAERDKKPFFSIEDLQNRGKVNQSTIDKMRLLGILDSMPESSQLSLF